MIALILLGAYSHAATARRPSEPASASDFTLKDIEGKTHALSDYKGKWIQMFVIGTDFTIAYQGAVDNDPCGKSDNRLN